MKIKSKFATLIAFATAAVVFAGSASAGEVARILEIDRFVGKIEMRTGPAEMLSVQVVPGRKETAGQSVDGITHRIVGNFDRFRNTNCMSNNGKITLRINGKTYEEGDLPTLIITAPNTIGLRIKGSQARGNIGDVGGATITMPGCGNLTLGNVARDLELDLAGSGNFSGGTIGGNVEINLAGSGDVSIGNVAGKADLNLAGSGDIAVSSGTDVRANIAGSGDIEISGGRGQLRANIAGSGDVRYQGTAINPQASIVGSGDVVVDAVEGQPRVSRFGSGGFRISQ